jgi:hypothetical protein
VKRDADGRGYADDGRAWWEEDHKYSDGSEAEEDGKGTRTTSPWRVSPIVLW